MLRRNVCFLTCGFMFTVLVIEAHGQSFGEDGLRTIAITGMPETTSGAFFASLQSGEHYSAAPSINNAGDVTVWGSLLGEGVTEDNDTGIWIESNETELKLVSREGDPVPGSTSGLRFGSLVPGRINSSGEVAFRSGLRGPGVDFVNSVAVWSSAGGSVHLVARQGDTAPGSSLVFETFYHALISDDGQVTIMGVAGNHGLIEENGTWRSRPGESLELVAMEGVPFGNEAQPLYFVSYSDSNSQGQILLGATGQFQGPASYWLENSSGFEEVVRQGDNLPNSDQVFASFSKGNLNDRGNIVFTARIEDASESFDRGSIWSDRDGTLAELPYTTNTIAPGTTASFYNFQDLALNNAQELAFVATLSGAGVDPYAEGVWIEDHAGNLSMVAYAGGTAPGTDFPFHTIESPIAWNNSGQVAFVASVREPSPWIGPRPRSATGIWATDRQGELHLVAMTTGTNDDFFLNVSDDPLTPDLRLIRTLGFGPQGFNDAGELAFRATFLDGSSGVFVSSAVAALPGDFNSDGQVNLADYTVWRDSLGQTGAGLAADGNGDSVVNALDYAVWKEHFGVSSSDFQTSSTATVPEPATMVLVLAFAAMASMRRVVRN